MNECFDKFLQNRCRLLAAGGNPSTRFRVFGKNPGWDDYFSLGDDSDALLMVQEFIEGTLSDDKGDLDAWALLETEGKAVALDHLFLWTRNKRSIAGRL